MKTNMTQDQIKELIEMRNDAKRQLDEILLMETMISDKEFLTRINNIKEIIINHCKTFNLSILDELKKDNFIVPDYLYIRM